MYFCRGHSGMVGAQRGPLTQSRGWGAQRDSLEDLCLCSESREHGGEPDGVQEEGHAKQKEQPHAKAQRQGEGRQVGLGASEVWSDRSAWSERR